MKTVSPWATSLAAVLFAGLAVAEAPATSLRPEARPGASGGVLVAAVAMQVLKPAPDVVSRTQVTASGVPVTIGSETRPRPRGGEFAATEVPADSVVQVSRQMTRIHFASDNRPSPRPSHPLAGYTVTRVSAMAATTLGAPHPKARPAGFGKLFKKRSGRYSAKGAVCGVNAIKGTVRSSIGKAGSGCGISNPVQVTSVSGVTLSRPATIDCTTAKALNAWVSDGIKPAVGQRGGGVSEITVFAHYACRTRNNRPGGKLSEHAKGHAVDVGGIRLKDGTEVTVLHGWRSKGYSKMLRQIHRSACGPFGTVLGPNADGYHQDHFHVDTARYRSGTYCR